MRYVIGNACRTGACGDEDCRCGELDQLEGVSDLDAFSPPNHEGCDCYCVVDVPIHPGPRMKALLVPVDED